MKRLPCLTLIGMPGAGKTTLGRVLAAKLDYAFVDTDFLIESLYGRRLEDITHRFSTEEFRDIECEVVSTLRCHACVIATGGSVIYRSRAMEHLEKLGAVIFLNPALESIQERILLNPERGISFAPGQGIEDLYRERLGLYRQYASREYDTELCSPEECAENIIADFRETADTEKPGDPSARS